MAKINWPFLIFGVLGGLAIFLYGMFLLNDRLQKVAGKGFKQLLITLTGTRIKSLLTGLGITSIIQSSSATTVMVVGLVSAGLMTYHQSLGVIKGAEIGTTVTAQLIAFRITDVALLFCAAGYLLSFFMKNPKAKLTLEAIFGFGLLFFGIKVMSDTLKPLRTYEPFLLAMRRIEHPIMGILVGLFFTCIIQSSSATSGIVISMAMAKTITLSQAIPINLGASIGTCITAFLASLRLNRDAKRSAYTHILFQTTGVLTVLPFLFIKVGNEAAWYVFVKFLTRLIFRTDDLPRQIAMSHTLMPVINAIIVMPLSSFISKMMCKIYPSREEDKPFAPMYLDEALLNTPSVALEGAKKEVLRMGSIIQEMMRGVMECFNKSERSFIQCETVKMSDIKVDKLNLAINEYLRRLTQKGLNEEESFDELSLLYITNDLENIGDIIDKNILPIATKVVEFDIMFDKEEWAEIREFHQKIMSNFSQVIHALKNNDKKTMETLTLTKPEIGRYESELRRKHINRLHAGIKRVIETSPMYLDLISQYKRINSHIVSIAYTILGQL